MNKNNQLRGLSSKVFFLKKILGVSLWNYVRKIGAAFLTPIRWSYYSGHFKSSLSLKSFDRHGKPLPWLTYPANDFLMTRDFSESSVLEFGGGNSTLFWASNAKSVVTLDENVDWVKYLRKKIPTNVTLFNVVKDRSAQVMPVREILSNVGEKKFDLVIVDGMNRQQMFLIGLEYLSSKGMIVCDNSDTTDYSIVWNSEGTEKFNFHKVDFYGHAPGVIEPQCTSVLFSADCEFTRLDVIPRLAGYSDQNG